MSVCHLLGLTTLANGDAGRRCAIALAFLTSGFCVISSQAHADDAKVARAILAQTRYQTILPEAHSSSFGLAGGNTAAGQKDHDDANEQQDQAANSPHTSNGAAPEAAPISPPQRVDVTASAATRLVLQLLPILLLAIVVMMLVYFGVKAYLKRQRPLAPKEIPIAVASRTTIDDKPIAPGRIPEWQNLANQERFTDAIHVLLLQLLTEMRRDNLIDLSASLTSREILRAPDLPTHRRAGLSTVVGAVEFCHFGGRPAGPQLYERCLDAYRQAIAVTPSHAAIE
jgi:hypothetical protein